MRDAGKKKQKARNDMKTINQALMTINSKQIQNIYLQMLAFVEKEF